MVFILSTAWLILLRMFAKTMVTITEVFKICALVWLGVRAESPVFYVFAILYLFLIIWKKGKLEFAAKMIAHSALALKENPTIVFALITLKICYLLQAVLVITSLVRVPSILERDSECEIKQPGWVQAAIEIICIHWLWSICFYKQVSERSEP